MIVPSTSTTTKPTTTEPPTTDRPTTTATPTPPAPDALTAEEAGALVAGESGPFGNWVPDTSTYDSMADLSGVIGNTEGATGTSPQQLFFFHQGQYLGTASSTPRFAFEITDDDGTTVTVRYLHYAPGDASCCPSDQPYVTRYQWNGTKVVPLDPIPPEGQGMDS